MSHSHMIETSLCPQAPCVYYFLLSYTKVVRKRSICFVKRMKKKIVEEFASLHMALANKII